MKKIIEGKRYDTETAKRVGTWSDGYPSDLNYIEETLYRKKTGAFFLHGVGGANTRYSTQTGANSWAGGEAIVPMTYEEAQQWAEEHLTGDEYEAIFGEVQEDDSVITIAMTQTAATAEKAKRAAAKKGMNFSAYIASLILTDVEGEN